MGRVLSLLFALLCFNVYSFPSDTVFSDYTDSGSIFRPWLQPHSFKDPLHFTEQAALRGRMGLNVIFKEPDLIYQKAKFHDNSWQRFYFRIDSLGDSSKASEAFFINGKQQREISFLAYSVSQKLQKEQDDIIVDFKFIVDSKDSSLSLIGSLWGMIREKISMPIIRNHVYCVESNLNFFNPESVSLTCYVDGVFWGQKKTAYSYPHDFFKVLITNEDKRYFFEEYGRYYYFTLFHFSIDEFALAAERLYTIPITASACSSIVHGGQVKMLCGYMQSGYFNEEIKSCRWQVFPFDSMPFPLFDAVETEPKYFYQRAIPFSLDNGRYKWRVCFKNNFGKWGDWSRFTEFAIKDQQKKFIVKNAYYTENGKRKHISRIIAGKWYDFHLNIDSRMGWDSTMYVLVLIHDSTYNFGHLANKGGKFIARSNYVYNLSFSKSKYVLFEKEGENSVSSIPLGTDSSGVYLDVSNHGLVVDTINGHIKFRARFLPNAKIGLWQLSAGVVYLDGHSLDGQIIENNSNLYGFTFQVVNPAKTKMPWKKIWFFLALLSVAVLIILRLCGKRNTVLRNKETEVKTDDEFEKIVQYIEKNLDSELTVNKILADFKLSKSSFYQIINRNHVEFRKLLTNIRIKRAKKLLEETEMNISEAAYSVGFTNLSHFTIAFKKIFNKLPSQINKLPKIPPEKEKDGFLTQTTKKEHKR